MRIAVLSDIHGNLRAFEAVLGDLRCQAPDLVVHAGDLVVMHASPAAVEEAPPVEATDRELVDTYGGLGPRWWSTPTRTDRSSAGSAR